MQAVRSHQQLADKIGARQHTVARWEPGVDEPKGTYAMLRELSETVKRRRKIEKTDAA